MKQIEQVITTLDVAEMMETEHGKILRKLEGDQKVNGIIPTLTQAKIGVSDYFKESTYKDASGKENKCYLVTKLGCDFLANKFTGEKGILFTARYVKRFHDMEDTINKPLTQLEILSQSVDVLNRHENEIKQIDNRMDKLEFDIPLYGSEADELSGHVRRKGVKVLGGKQSEAYKDSEIRSKVYRDIYDQIRREFGIFNESGHAMTYKALKRKYLADAHEFIDCYDVPTYLLELINNANAQARLDIA